MKAYIPEAIMVKEDILETISSLKYIKSYDITEIASKREPSLVELDEIGNMFLKMLSRVTGDNASTMLGTEEQE